MADRILHIVYSLEIGGLERVVIALVNCIDPRAFESTICCITRTGELSASLRGESRLRCIGHRGRINPRAIREIIRVAKETGADLIHTHNLPGLLYGFPAAKLCRLPLVHTQHGRVLRERSAVLNTIEKLLSRSVGAYVCVSGQLCDDARSAVGVPEAKIELIYNGIEVPDTRDADERKNGGIIGSVGRLNPIKNYGTLVRAFSALRASFPEWRLELVGGGECHDDLARLVAELDLGNGAVLHGYQLDVNRYLRTFDIFVLPSFSEGHSISLLEAMSLEKVCIVSRVGGNPEIITDGVNGYLFDPHDTDELVERIAYVIERYDSPEIRHVKRMGRETVLSKFSIETMLAKYGHLYRNLIGSGGADRGEFDE